MTDSGDLQGLDARDNSTFGIVFTKWMPRRNSIAPLAASYLARNALPAARRANCRVNGPSLPASHSTPPMTLPVRSVQPHLRTGMLFVPTHSNERPERGLCSADSFGVISQHSLHRIGQLMRQAASCPGAERAYSSDPVVRQISA